MITKKPWGHEELLHQGYGYAVKKISLEASHRTSLHFHRVKHEHIYVLSGSMEVFIKTEHEERTVIMNAGDHLAINPSEIHQMAGVLSDCVYLESQTDDLEDVVRLADDYKR